MFFNKIFQLHLNLKPSLVLGLLSFVKFYLKKRVGVFYTIPSFVRAVHCCVKKMVTVQQLLQSLMIVESAHSCQKPP